MCGRFVQYSDPEIYASHFDLDVICQATPRYNVVPTQPVLAIRQTREGKGTGSPALGTGAGLVHKGPDSRYSMITARAASVSAKPAYRNAFKYRRSLIPAESVCEWKAQPGGKRPFLIRCKDSAPFAMAGLWERWHGEDAAELEACTIIVTIPMSWCAAFTTACRSSCRRRTMRPGSIRRIGIPIGLSACSSPPIQTVGPPTRSQKR
jgi:putative SOS response-associated peptidase YedK